MQTDLTAEQNKTLNGQIVRGISKLRWRKGILWEGFIKEPSKRTEKDDLWFSKRVGLVDKQEYLR